MSSAMPRITLIVEDSEACAETLQIALETLPEMETRAVRGVQAALKLMADTDNEIVAIVTDMNMPRRDGFDLLGDRVRVRVTGEVSLVAEITPASVADLGLREGQDVWTTVKATEVETYPV